MSEKELEELFEQISIDSKENLFDNIFQVFIDNKISVQELELLFKKINYNLPNEFYSLPKDKQKEYFQHNKKIVLIEENKVNVITQSIFNKAYFDYLVNSSIKNKNMTTKLIEYSNRLDWLPIYILTMQNVRLKNIDFIMRKECFVDIIDNETFNGKKIKTLYDLYFYVFSMPDNKIIINKKINLIMQLNDFMKNKSKFKLDMESDFVKFVLSIELILSSIPRKNANTIKMKFLCYKKNYLNDNEYNKNLKNCKNLINKHKQSMKINKIRAVVDYYNGKKKILDSFNYNGYIAIFYCLFEVINDE